MTKAATKAKSADKAKPAATKAVAKGKWDSRKLHTVTPHLVCAGAVKAMEFYKKAFGATEVMRLEGPDGSLWHGCVTIGDSAVMVVDEMPAMGSLGPKALSGTTVTIHLNVPDADASIERAAAAGAKVLMPAADMFWGDRYGVIEDPFGHKWSVATHLRDMTVDEIKAAMSTMGPPE